MAPVSAAEKFFQGLRGDRGDRAPGRAGVLPDRCGQPGRKPDSERRGLVRDADPPRCRGLADVTARLAFRAARPAGQHAGRLRRRNTRFQQLSRSVDAHGMLSRARTAIASHDMRIMHFMSFDWQLPPPAGIMPLTAPAVPHVPARSTTRPSAPWTYP